MGARGIFRTVRNRQGLTLVEILLTVALFAGLAFVVAQLFVQQSQDFGKMLRVNDRDRGVGLVNQLAAQPSALLKS